MERINASGKSGIAAEITETEAIGGILRIVIGEDTL